ncbi:MAG: pilus assembly protein [Gammaproteobacteria bacterium]
MSLFTQTLDNLISASTSAEYGKDLGGAGNLSRRPSYLIELLPAVDDLTNESVSWGGAIDPSYYRITAYGQGKTAKAIAVVQGIYQHSLGAS